MDDPFRVDASDPTAPRGFRYDDVLRHWVLIDLAAHVSPHLPVQQSHGIDDGVDLLGLRSPSSISSDNLGSDEAPLPTLVTPQVVAPQHAGDEMTRLKRALQSSRDFTRWASEMLELALAESRTAQEASEAVISELEGRLRATEQAAVEAARVAAEAAEQPLVSDCNEERSIRSEALLCAVCLDRCKEVAFQCGHMACSCCARQLTSCPMCRCDVERSTRLFF